LKARDIVVMYRTSDKKGPAWYRSVATSVCVVEDVQPNSHFANDREFVRYCYPYSVFPKDELKRLYSSTRFAIRMTYNLAMRKRLTRKKLVQDVGLDPAPRWSLLPLTDEQFDRIAKEGDVDESAIIR